MLSVVVSLGGRKNVCRTVDSPAEKKWKKLNVALTLVVCLPCLDGHAQNEFVA